MGHVMISYNWGAQERMIKLRDALLEAGYKVWMDIDNMGKKYRTHLNIIVICMALFTYENLFPAV